MLGRVETDWDSVCPFTVSTRVMNSQRMEAMYCLMVLWVLCVGSNAQNRFQMDIDNNWSLFKSWNSRLYPRWQDYKNQWKDSWKGGEVTFDLVNDAPTMSGALITFYINLKFPQYQSMLPNGQVIWNQDNILDDTWVRGGEPVYNDEYPEGLDCMFPDGIPFPCDPSKRHNKFVYVWNLGEKYWQVIDGPSSTLSLETDDIPLGTYTMEVVAYHYRGRRKFIPIGHTVSRFTITDVIPMSVSVSQLYDLDQGDNKFIQNRAISFNVAVHDPSNYLGDADLSFTWDFGDQSGIMITRNTQVTHTYVSTGAFVPKVLLQAAIPIASCGSTASIVTAQSSSATAAPAQPTTAEGAATSGGQATVAPTVSSNTVTVGGVADGVVITVASVPEENLEAESILPNPETEALPAEVEAEEAETEALPAEVEAEEAEMEALPVEVEAEEAGTVSEALPAEGEAVETEGDDVEAEEAVTEALPVEEEAVETDIAAESDVEVEEAGTVPEALPVDEDTVEAVAAEGDGEQVAGDETVTLPVALPVEGEAVEDEVGVTAAGEGEAETLPVVEEEQAVLAEEAEETLAQAALSEMAEDIEAVTDAELTEVSSNDPLSEINEQPVLTDDLTTPADEGSDDQVIVKRQAPEDLLAGCLLHRYGTYVTELHIVRGIESAEIVQVAAAEAINENTVELKIACQGSVPSQVCTVVSDPDCSNPQETVCDDVEPSTDCQLVLRRTFNESGQFCVNVSLTDAVSLAVASTQVSVSPGAGNAATSVVGITVGAVFAVLAVFMVVVVAYTYRQKKPYAPLKKETSTNWFRDRLSLRLFFRNAHENSTSGETSPLLAARVV
ncbi:hypothetical protein GDO86_004297 [Hymenochirus boettgeri]|uniref:PKD domain-containing protein n=1 Tax=Hymenochirus boettgeri TaxID=247094 RepID=A0A8T2KA11_9PIPI|nr:hypothetical protein GDO86_004297 [Hymenochirus boettgeri]